MSSKNALKAYFSTKDGKTIYTHTSPLLVRVFTRYEDMGVYRVDEHVYMLGIFDMEIDGKHYGMNIPGQIKLSPSTIHKEDDYYVLTFNKGDEFIMSNHMVKENFIPYLMFKMFVVDGRRYPFMNNTNITRIFDYLSYTGLNISAVHPVYYGAFFSELHRSDTDINKRYRHTDLKGGIRILGMKDVKITASKLTTKLSGSYAKETLKAALTQAHSQNSEIEDILRM